MKSKDATTQLWSAVQCMAAIGVMAYLPAMANASEYENHVACNEEWRDSTAYDKQDCKSHRINYDGETDGIHYCYHDIYCDAIPGRPNSGASRKGLIDILKLRYLRRCEHDVTVINTECRAYQP
ncbi:MAG: hypothetical protein OXU70_14530 [Gammaproteobacteria bacterium]|nr:hypothetical protein [Gammaproteobacteria bacterium]